MGAPQLIDQNVATGTPVGTLGGTTNTIPRWTGPTTLGDSLITQTLAGAPFEATRIRVATGVDTYAWFRDSVPSGNVLFVAANAAFGMYKGLEIASAGTYFTFGNVGIGTTSPSGRLSVTDAVGSNGQSGLNVGTIAAPVRGNLWYVTDGTGWKYQIGKWQSGAFTPQMTFQDDGSVGIGTTSPSTRLHVSDNSSIPVIVQSSGSTDSYLRFINTANNLGYIGYVGTNLYLAPNNGAGNVGIGTAGPGFKLDVNGSINSQQPFYINGGSQGFITWAGSAANTLNLMGAVGRAISLGSNGVYDRLYLDTSGNVGIGTASPISPLHVKGNATNTEGTLSLTPNTGGRTWQVISQQTSSIFRIYDQSLPADRLLIDSLGNIYGTSGTTSMTGGFFYIPAAAGAPTGTPTALSGRVPMYYDTTNNEFYVYNGAWKKVTLT